MAFDAATGKKINNAIVKLKIAFASNGKCKEFVGHCGEVKYSTDIKPNLKNSSNINIKTTVLASAPGYISTFKTSSLSTFTSIMTSKSNQSSVNNNLTLNMFKENLSKLVLTLLLVVRLQQL